MGRAVVIGASVAGALCARQLADHFDEVVVVDRDDQLGATDGSRRAVPQGRHLHALWHTGLSAMEALLPGLVDELAAAGAIPNDAGYDFGWWQLGRRRAPVRLGERSLMMTRPLLEATVRSRVLGLPNVRVERGRVEGLSATGAGVDGVVWSSPSGPGDTDRLPAALVADCSGRASQLGSWLSALGYEPPAPSQVSMEIGYATRTLRRAGGERLADGTMGLTSLAAPPAKCRGAALVAVEGGRWMLTVAGYADDRPSSDAEDFSARCRDEGVPPLDALMDQAEPVSEVVTYRMPTSIRRDYHRMARFPAGLVVAGDAVASFNPVYGQGMTCAALHARALGSYLHDRRGSIAEYLREVKKFTDRAWSISVTEDFRLPTTRGPRPPGTALSHWLGDRYARAVLVDGELHHRFLRAASMEVGTTLLLEPAALVALRRSGRSGTGRWPAGPRSDRAPAG